MKSLISLFAGALFSAGLLTSGMTDTKTVQGFLDIFGAWNPTLAFVMGGAMIPMILAWAVSVRMSKPVYDLAFPTKKSGIDARLVIGASMFGIGWGLVGLCPGPAIASLSFGGWSGVTFFAAMCAGMIGYGVSQRASA
ncbi:MAG: DUF6691 family protein [Pseudomonadota bacterium]